MNINDLQQRESNMLIPFQDNLVPLLFRTKSKKWTEGYWTGVNDIITYNGEERFLLDEIDTVIIL